MIDDKDPSFQVIYVSDMVLKSHLLLFIYLLLKSSMSKQK